ncbi:hypothetical protein [Halosegnis marinus]|uniref:hypothetical protein n=1 Tax=Halosegnis marinus TaxID=3034023 RepID=UPI0036136D97
MPSEEGPGIEAGEPSPPAAGAVVRGEVRRVARAPGEVGEHARRDLAAAVLELGETGGSSAASSTSSASSATANPAVPSSQSATARCSSVAGRTTQGVPATAASIIVEYPEQTTRSAARR